ncbi:armadillo-type protein [Pisolithus orientalis]|uniref:armadillo-type protein n=1 Tax=Pisolithus orientalis TaxID=936130 RepID=UPI0022243F8A|nr:armadillo-type protein [Pisolithus orientalis]KAI6012635.1 armadillo-type protein [Pisolithus orientalis]
MTSNSIQDILADTLSSDANRRMSAELNLSEVLQHQGSSENVDVSIRQIIVLRKYVTERWSPYFPSFKGNSPSVEVKCQIRHAVFQGLSDPNRKIRSLSASGDSIHRAARTLSSIASCDWPDEYPDLLSSLIQLISSNSPDAVHGSMQVLTEFIKSDLTEDQILPVLRQLLPVLLAILGAPEQHMPLTRARAVSVFRQCVTALYMVKGQHPEAVKEATSIHSALLLNLDPAQELSNQENWDGLFVEIYWNSGLLTKGGVLQTLGTIHTSFQRAMVAYLPDYLNAALHHLQVIYVTYNRCYITASENAPGSSEDEAVELPHLICPIFDFLSNEEMWAANANAFVAQEEDEIQTYGVRPAGFELLYTLLDRSAAQVCTILQEQLQRTITNSHLARDGEAIDWWKALEAALAVIGSHAEDILECIDDEVESGRTKPIDIEDLLANLIPSILTQTRNVPSEFPFLQGRAFVFASQFAKLLPLQIAGQYLEAATQVLESNVAGIPVKVSAVKAIHNFCEGAEDSAVRPFAPRITQDLGPFLLVTTEDTLSLVLEAMSVVLDVDKGSWLSQDLANSLVIAVLEVWAKNNKDPIFLSIFTEILESLAASRANGVYETVVKQALPTLCTAIANAKPDEPWIAGSAIDLVSSLVRGGPEGGLGEGFFAHLAPSLFNCLEHAEDRDVLQDCSQILSWSDSNSQPGLDHILKLVAKLLQNEDESGGLVIGDLITHLLRRVGESVLPVLPELLRAMAQRMLTAKTATFLQSLVIPFAFLVCNQADTLISLLESTRVQDRSALDIVIHTWCENAETFQGFWPTRISTIALSRLYASARPSLRSLKVKGDIIVKPETKNVIMTRSKTKTIPHEFTSIPFPVKVLKLLVRELRSDGEPATIPGEGFEVDSDDGDEEWTEEEQQHQGFKEDEFAFLSEMLGPRGANFDNDDILYESDDEDLKNDPVSQINMKEHLIGFFKECAAMNTNNFAANVDQLSAEEILVIQQVVGK